MKITPEQIKDHSSADQKSVQSRSKISLIEPMSRSRSKKSGTVQISVYSKKIGSKQRKRQFKVKNISSNPCDIISTISFSNFLSNLRV
jgi:hypothetical protein